jgi:hypothetical protein
MGLRPDGRREGKPMAVWLEWVETGQVFPLPLGRPVRIGRGPHAEIRLSETSVGRQHCEARWDGCRVWVQDLASRCGTSINGKNFRDGTPVDRAAGALLRLGDVLRPGPVRLRLGTPSRAEAGWLTWQGGLVVALARQADESGDYGVLPVLADALEEAGCTDADLLTHCRSGGGHLRGCWAVDLLLGRS